MPHKLLHAGFRTPEGDIYSTGMFHDLNAVPAHIDPDFLESGFVTTDGKFLTRDQATAELHADHAIQSAELPLEKTETYPTDIKAYEHLVRTWLQKRLKQKALQNVKQDDTFKSMRLTCDDLMKAEFPDTNAAVDDVIMSAAARQTGGDTQESPEFKAARFMAGGKDLDPETEHEALQIHGDCLGDAALYAYSLPLTDANRAALASIMATQALKKAELDVAALPRDVEGVFADSNKTVAALRRAFVRRDVKRMALKGKHSAGVAVAYDEKTHQHFLLKPGSGPLSPAAGIREEPANQSRREVAFVKVAQSWGLGDDFPDCHLVVLDGVECAAMELLPPDYVNIGRVRDDAAKILTPYQKSGRLFKWAVLDAVAAQSDRHSGNVMCNPKDNDRVKLIDEGSTFAGFGFDPAHDPRSYIVYYLRCFSGANFKVMTPEQRRQVMPSPDPETQAMLQAWINGLNESDLRAILVQYGISLGPTLDRLNRIQSEQDGIGFVLDFWAGLVKFS